MKDVISVDKIKDMLFETVWERMPDSKYIHVRLSDKDVAKLHSLLISKLPEKKTGTIKLGSYSESDIDQIEEDTAIVITYRQGYNSAIDDMRKSIDELFEVKK